MYALLYGLSIVAAAAGAFYMRESKTALHEIQALICFVAAAVLCTGGAITRALHLQSVPEKDRSGWRGFGFGVRDVVASVLAAVMLTVGIAAISSTLLKKDQATAQR